MVQGYKTIKPSLIIQSGIIDDLMNLLINNNDSNNYNNNDKDNDKDNDNNDIVI